MHLPATARLAIGAANGHRLPAIGLGVPLGLETMTDAEAAAVEALAPGWLMAEVDAGDTVALNEQLSHLRALMARSGAKLQLDIICPEAPDPAAVASRVAQACAAARLTAHAVRACPAAYLKSFQPSDCWPDVPPLERYARALAEAFPQSRIGGGMLTYFTELNRKRQTAEALHFVGHSTCPLVHAADDVSVMQTLESLAGIHASVRAHWPALGYRLGPITLAMHRNPYGERTAANPERKRLAMAEEDPRHQAAFGAAWLVGYLAAVQSFNLELLAFHHSHGLSGPLLGAHMPDWQPGDRLPGWQAALCVPGWRVHGLLSRSTGCALRQVTGLPAGLAALAWSGRTGAFCELLLANLSPDPVRVELAGVWHGNNLSAPCAIEALAGMAAQPGLGLGHGLRGAPQSRQTEPQSEAATTFVLDRYQTRWLLAPDQLPGD